MTAAVVPGDLGVGPAGFVQSSCFGSLLTGDPRLVLAAFDAIDLEPALGGLPADVIAIGELSDTQAGLVVSEQVGDLVWVETGLTLTRYTR